MIFICISEFYKMEIDYSKHRKEFFDNGYTLIEDVVLRPKEWSSAILNSSSLKKVFVHESNRTVEAGKGHLKYSAMDRFSTDMAIPDMYKFYSSLPKQLEKFTYSDIILSPFKRTAYYTKVYMEDGDEQGWHYDTNDLTVVLYLTDVTQTGATEILSIDSKTINKVWPKAGAILVLQGQKYWHRASPVTNTTKVICPLNYYLSEPEARHPDLDAIIFGE